MLFKSLEYVCKIVRVISSACHYLRAEYVSFRFILAAEFQKISADASLKDLADGRTTEDCAANAEYACEYGILSGFRSLRRSVTKRYVAKLMSHDARYLTFISRGLNHSAIDVHRTARKSESVNVVRVDYAEIVVEFWMLKLLRNRCDKAIAYGRDIIFHFRVAQERHLLFDFCRSLTTYFNVVLRTVLVAV